MTTISTIYDDEDDAVMSMQARGHKGGSGLRDSLRSVLRQHDVGLGFKDADCLFG